MMLAIITLLGRSILIKWKRGEIRFCTPLEKKYPVRGIDISHHQEAINWQALKEEEISYVFCKATEGLTFRDKMFQENRLKATGIGIDVGAYHFFLNTVPGVDQAMNFISVVPKTVPLPPVLDIEHGYFNRRKGKSKAQIQAEILDFLQTVTDHYGKKPIIYADPFIYYYLLRDIEFEYSFWLDGKFWRPILAPGIKWTFWQFTNKGKLKGVNGFVDLNVFRGNEDDYERFKLESGLPSEN